MKHKLLLAIALVLVAAQAWAMPTDSLPMGHHGLQFNTLLKKDWQPLDSLINPIIIEPTILVNPKSLDFGTVQFGRTVIRTFTVRGIKLNGNLTLQVLSTRSSSSDGFTINKTTITPTEAMRGVTVSVTFKPPYVGTYNTTSVHISGGGAESKVIPLTATCVSTTPAIEPSITVTPTSLDFGTVMLGRSVSKTFKVKGTNLTGPLTLNVLTSRSGSSDGFTINKTTITAAQAMLGATVRVTYEPEYVGTHNTTSVFISGGGVETQEVTLTGTCIESSDPPIPITPSITVTPTSLDFGTVMLGRSVSKTFTVRGINLTEPLTLQVLTSRSNSSDGFRINTTTITPKQALLGATVTVTYEPEYVGTQNTTSVFISGGGVETQEVTLTGTCVDRVTPPDVMTPTITVNPSSLDFGTVLYGRSSTKTFTVTGLNLMGNLTLDVLTTRSSSSDGFGINTTTITPSQAMNGVTVTVTYRPLYQGTQNSTFVRISGGGAESKEVALTGTCIGANAAMSPSLVGSEPSTVESMGNATTSVNERVLDVNISAQGRDIIIDSAVEQSAIISDISGRARRVDLKAGRNVIPTGTSGLYVVRVGNNTAKLLMK